MSRQESKAMIDAATYRRATLGFASCFVDSAPLKLHWNPFMYTTYGLADLVSFPKLDNMEPTLFGA